jgi:hypothetical protein
VKSDDELGTAGASSDSSASSDAVSGGAVAGVAVGVVAGVALVGAAAFAVVKRLGGSAASAENEAAAV